MEYAHKEAHRFALKKTSNWQSILLVAMGLFYSGIVLLTVGEFTTAYYRSTSYYISMGIIVAGLSWAGYIWVNLLQNILATRAYLRSGKEDDLQKAYKKQRLFWKSIVIIIGLCVGLIACVFMAILIDSGGRF